MALINENNEPINMDGFRPIKTNTLTAIEQMEEIDPARVQPIEFRVLLKVMECKTTYGDGLVLKPASVIEKELFGKCTSTVVSVGDQAFTLSDGTKLENAPKPGDVVVTAKYAGITVRDKDFNLYRFCNDKDIVAIYKNGDAA